MKHILLAFLLGLLIPASVSARVGVGVGTGKIVVKDQLKPGIIYQLPPLTVLNTGDEVSEYGLSVEYHENQPEQRPAQEWFVFSPPQFSLEPGGVQQVEITLNLPVRATPGEYFAYLEAHPRKSDGTGGTSINIAAAAKLYFAVVPATVLSALYYRAASFWQVYAPWPKLGVISVGIIAVVLMAKKHLKITIGLKNEGKRLVPKRQ